MPGLSRGSGLSFSDGLNWLDGGLGGDGLTAPDFNPITFLPFAWYAPTLSTLFQDAAMTIPVTASGDPVGAMLDRSGNGHTVTQSSDAARPTYRTSGALRWLEFTGDQSLSASFTSPAEPVDRLSALDVTGDGTNNYLFRPNPGFSGGLYEVADTSFIIFDGGANLSFPLNPTRNVDVVVTEQHIANASMLAVDNAAYVTGDAGSTFSDGLVIGGGRAFKFSGMLMKATFTDVQIAALRTYLAALQGRVL